MAMLVVGGEKNFKALRGRLFDEAVPAATARRASAAIAEANPGVDLKKLVPGTVLRIPDDPDIPAPSAALSLDGGVHDDVERVAAVLLEGMEAMHAEAKTSIAEMAPARALALQALASQQVVAAANADANLKDDLAAAKASLEKEDQVFKNRLMVLESSIAVWSADVVTLRGLAGQGGQDARS